jgi:DNA-binding GntR family transcriptional regulator
MSPAKETGLVRQSGRSEGSQPDPSAEPVGHARGVAAFEQVRSADLVTQVTERLARAVYDGRLRPGARLVEAAVARQMGISRGPLREAARRLEQRGLLVARPRRGFFVRDFTPAEIDDIYGLRIVLECYAMRLACARASDRELRDLRTQLEHQRALAAADAVVELVEADLQFHRMVCAASGNRRLDALFADLAGEVRLIIALIGQLFDDPERIAETHTPLLAALEARDPERAAAEADHHIRVAWEAVRTLFAKREHGAAAPTDDPPAPSEEVP